MDSTFMASVDESARRRFEAAWKAGRPEAIERFLPADDDPRYLATLEEFVLIELEMAWRSCDPGRSTLGSGIRPFVESYLLRFPKLNEPNVLLRLLRQEYRVRQRYGDGPSAAEYDRRFPGLGRNGKEFDTTQRVAAGGDAVPAVVDVPGYDILSTLGRGGMGIVYKARQLSLNRIVALKMIRGGAQANEEDLARFRAEAEAVARLQHPNIVQIHEVGEAQGQPYFSLEFVGGGSLDKKIAGVPQPPRTAAEIVEVLARAVYYAHANGIIHRDLKPGNILLQIADRRLQIEGKPHIDPSEQSALCNLQSAIFKITDFGLAKRLQTADASLDEHLTQSGAILGTPSYMAPEQAAGKREVGPAADVYALGAILYEMIAGRPPFRAATSVETMVQVLQNDPVPPSRLQPRLPRDLETICLKCLEKEPRKRYGTAQELADDLRRFLAEQPILARPLSLAQRFAKLARRQPLVAGLSGLLAIVFLVGLAGIIWQWRQAESHRELAEDRAGAEKAAREAKEAALSRAEAHLHFHRIALADREWWDANLAVSNRLLEQCPKERRDWVWRLLEHRCHSEVASANLVGQSLAYSSDGTQLAVQSGGVIHLVSTRDGSRIRSLQSNKALRARRVAFSADGKQLAACGHPWAVVVWDVATGAETHRFQGSKGDAFSIAFSANGQQLAVGGGARGAGEVRVWSLAQSRLTAKLTGHEYPVDYLAFGPDGSWLAAAAWDHNVRIWDIANRKELRSVKEMVHGIALTPDGKALATANVGGTIKIWDVATGGLLRTLAGHKSDATCLAFAPDGRRLVSGSNDTTVRLWDWRAAETIAVIRGHAAEVRDVAFSPDGSRIASTAENTRIWNAALTQEGQLLTRYARTFAFSPNSKKLVTATHGNHSLTLWDLATVRPAMNIRAHAGPITAVAFAPREGWLASAGRDRAVKIWDAVNGTLLQSYAAASPVRTLAVPPYGKSLAFAGDDGVINIWEWNTKRKPTALAGHKGSVNALDFNHDGSRLASAGEDKTVRVWEAATGAAVFSAAGHHYPATSVAFSPDGTRLASAAGADAKQAPDGEIKTWDANHGKEIISLGSQRAAIADVSFSPSGGHLASAGKSIKIWEPLLGLEVLNLKMPDDWFAEMFYVKNGFTRVRFSPDGAILAAQSSDSGVWLWQAGQSVSPPPRRTALALGTLLEKVNIKTMRRFINPGEELWKGVRMGPSTPLFWINPPDENMVVPIGLQGVLTMGGGHTVNELTLDFDEPILGLELTRVGVVTGTSVPRWRMEALDHDGKLLATTGEVDFSMDGLPRTFAVRAAGIVRVRILSDNRYPNGQGIFSTFNSPPVAEFVLER